MRSDWAPLELMLGPKLCECFMFMGRSGELYLYKHIDTRRYLNLDAEGNPAYIARYACWRKPL